MKISVVNKSAFDLPAYATVASSGLDLRANIEEDIVLKPLERVLVPTGLFIAIPEGYEAQIRPRSGLAFKHGVTVLNTPGTIDADYRGEIKVILVNLSNEDFTIVKGERICQMVFAKVQQIEWKLVENLDDTDRGEGGFGHTGRK
jgi:dUTP pyrophosphatase